MGIPGVSGDFEPRPATSAWVGRARRDVPLLVLTSKDSGMRCRLGAHGPRGPWPPSRRCEVGWLVSPGPGRCVPRPGTSRPHPVCRDAVHGMRRRQAQGSARRWSGRLTRAFGSGCLARRPARSMRFTPREEPTPASAAGTPMACRSMRGDCFCHFSAERISRIARFTVGRTRRARDRLGRAAPRPRAHGTPGRLRGRRHDLACRGVGEVDPPPAIHAERRLQAGPRGRPIVVTGALAVAVVPFGEEPELVTRRAGGVEGIGVEEQQVSGAALDQIRDHLHAEPAAFLQLVVEVGREREVVVGRVVELAVGLGRDAAERDVHADAARARYLGLRVLAAAHLPGHGVVRAVVLVDAHVDGGLEVQEIVGAADEAVLNGAVTPGEGLLAAAGTEVEPHRLSGGLAARVRDAVAWGRPVGDAGFEAGRGLVAFHVEEWLGVGGVAVAEVETAAGGLGGEQHPHSVRTDLRHGSGRSGRGGERRSGGANDKRGDERSSEEVWDRHGRQEPRAVTRSSRTGGGGACG
ncbi:hypothetical protein MXAN_5258 [Myxococcus xanthus DK 1622]|uniref:Uncharacterized protein n=1 Tax=Myxococcus xanthus (strain DK1622) TaxID=246197 RepID=Q1D1R3_MYXXD|nr:hypothetical protein MXAN_5258 [Myxococcus xanthus DK 1622]